MDKLDKKKQLEERLAKAEERAKKEKNAIKTIRDRLKTIDKPEIGLSSKQQNTIKIWHGIACLALIKENSDFAKNVREYLEKHVKSTYQRKLMGLTVTEQEAAKSQPEIVKTSAVFGKIGPVLATERIDLVVPFPDPPEEKEQAKAAGAKWDSQARKWYVLEGFDLTRVERWLPQDRNWQLYDL